MQYWATRLHYQAVFAFLPVSLYFPIVAPCELLVTTCWQTFRKPSHVIGNDPNPGSPRLFVEIWAGSPECD